MTDGDARLDVAMVDRGLARSRTHAARLIADGLVTAAGVATVKPSHRVAAADAIEVAGLDHYVSRAAHKLIGALDAFGLDVTGRTALDVGASTGGFSQVLVERGAGRVIALDVGHGQLAASVRSDPRVTVVEGFNARYLTRDSLVAATHNVVQPDTGIDLVVADLSFISLGTVLPAIVDTVGTGADYVLLVKPQFEVGRGGIREGVVRQAPLRTDAVNGVLWSAWDLGLRTAGVMESPLIGTNGNHEYLILLNTSTGVSPSEWSERVTSVTTA